MLKYSSWRKILSGYLCVFQNSPQLLQLAVEDNVDGARLLHLPQDLLVLVLVLEAELVDNRPQVRVCGGLEQLLQPDQPLVVLVEDGEAAPPKGLDQGHVGLRDQSRAWVKVDRVAVPGPHIVPSGFCQRTFMNFTFIPLSHQCGESPWHRRCFGCGWGGQRFCQRVKSNVTVSQFIGRYWLRKE